MEKIDNMLDILSNHQTPPPSPTLPSLLQRSCPVIPVKTGIQKAHKIHAHNPKNF